MEQDSTGGRTAEQERADVLAFLDDVEGMDSAFFRLAGARTRESVDAMKATVRSVRKTLADGAHVGLAARKAVAP